MLLSAFDESRCLRYFCSLLQRQFGRLYAKVAVYVSLEGAYSDIFVDFLFFLWDQSSSSSPGTATT